ncbi:phage tail protein [Ancylothrix sp. C2]|uniref:phage tail protein n=1 Tax=Ancylothrix sp. D3o TaxID=2953691 RepID=UPI0021BBB13C|nr:phage tail protein [Ancylothrix sp. D3o]MCT7948231.1 phage tail protein [Ancylothrix sp. D3o]
MATKNNNSVQSGKLEKAKLISDESDTIEFMFNPTQLVFQQSVQLNPSDGARTESGLPKVSFGYPEPCTLSLSDILLDRYEEGTSVLDDLRKMIKAVNFAEKGDAKGKRPPIYIFTWGEQQYLRCFVESITYKLTMFLPNGLPVQAKIDMTLKEVDASVSQPNQKSVSANRQSDNRQNRLISGR